MPTRASCVPGSSASPHATAALDQLGSRESEGIGVRVRMNGAWGFAAVRGTGRAEAEAALRRALAIAEAQPRVPDAAPLAPEPPARGEWSSALERDPFEVPLEEKLAVLLAADAGLRTEPGVNLTRAQFAAFRTETVFASTDGALCEQLVTECGGGIAAVAVRGSDSQIRSYPASHGGHVAEAGYEHFLRARAARPRAASGIGGGRAARRAGVPARALDARPRRRAARPPGPRVGRPRGRARPRARARGLLRRHELRAGGRDRVAAARLRARQRDRRRHDAGRPRQLPLGRRGRGGQAGADRARRGAAPDSSPRARPRRRSASSARAAACARRASRASRSCG